jgi:hypothetical protein
MWRVACTSVLIVLLTLQPACACTIFMASKDGVTLVGNNEDFFNPFTRVWFVPAEKGKLGRVYFGFDNGAPQGGMNERGLCFDANALPSLKPTRSQHKPAFPGNLMEKVMEECSTVEEALALFDKYNLVMFSECQVMIIDAGGDAAIVQGDEIIRKVGRFQVSTNFRQSPPNPSAPKCQRYAIAMEMLGASNEPSVPLFRSVLAATHQEGDGPTQYSNIYDLKKLVVHVYHFHNFENVVTLDLRKELEKGPRTLEIKSLFPRTHAAEAFERAKLEELEKRKAARRTVKLDAAALNAFTGEYSMPGAAQFSITREDSKLYCTNSRGRKVELTPQSESSFFYIDISGDVDVNFSRDKSGKVSHLTIKMLWKEVVAQKVK